MTDQQTSTGVEDAPQDDAATTDYVVLVAVEIDLEPMEPFTGWREAGVLSVPQRTQRSTVVQKAGEMASQHGENEEGRPVRFRVYPLDAHTEGEAQLTTPAPQLTVTTL